MQVKSEGPLKITKATIDAAWKRRQKASRLIIRDKDCRGLALIVNATTLVWSYSYRPRGVDPLTGRRWPNKAITLGNPATLSPDDARTEANRVKGQMVAGADPAAARKAKAAEEQRKRSATAGRLLKGYEDAFPKRPKMRGSGLPSPIYVSGEVAQVRLALEAMEATDSPAADIDVVTVRKLIDAQNAGDNPHARFGALSRFLDWCQDAGHIQINPCTLVARARRPKPRQSRSEYLVLSDMARLWEAAGRLGEPVWRDIARLDRHTLPAGTVVWHVS
ncbi:integrase arm-type DNA-binding domain-containing protein [Acidisphaera sp. S103]|uniref:integrase arm-type DNA-binding domain-containing protein n=1 Tax=Acidisphaera sp. S103 TaxID=1747223 RepID=UPI00131E4437|nr:integrase arm-type DNA-binding domain-containing protein [Acidisphaera sp. S103]